MMRTSQEHAPFAIGRLGCGGGGVCAWRPLWRPWCTNVPSGCQNPSQEGSGMMRTSQEHAPLAIGRLGCMGCGGGGVCAWRPWWLLFDFMLWLCHVNMGDIVTRTQFGKVPATKISWEILRRSDLLELVRILVSIPFYGLNNGIGKTELVKTLLSTTYSACCCLPL